MGKRIMIVLYYFRLRRMLLTVLPPWFNMSPFLKRALGSKASVLYFETLLQPAASSLVTISYAGSESQECTHGDLKERLKGGKRAENLLTLQKIDIYIYVCI